MGKIPPFDISEHLFDMATYQPSEQASGTKHYVWRWHPCLCPLCRDCSHELPVSAIVVGDGLTESHRWRPSPSRGHRPYARSPGPSLCHFGSECRPKDETRQPRSPWLPSNRRNLETVSRSPFRGLPNYIHAPPDNWDDWASETMSAESNRAGRGDRPVRVLAVPASHDCVILRDSG